MICGCAERATGRRTRMSATIVGELKMGELEIPERAHDVLSRLVGCVAATFDAVSAGDPAHDLPGLANHLGDLGLLYPGLESPDDQVGLDA